MNVVDNAIFWLKSLDKDKEITIDSDGESFLVTNNGPDIHQRDYEAIFEQGFTRKPGGRGLGLFISRKALQKEGMDISLLPSAKGEGVTFRIRWPHHDNDT